MFFLVFIILTIGSDCSQSDDDLPVLGIIGGLPVKQEQYNYQVAIEHYNEHRCSGALLDTNIVITAAHCIGYEKANYKVRVGSVLRESGGKLIGVEDMIQFANYSLLNFNYDVGIIKLNEHVELNENIGTVILTDSPPKRGTKGNISGWGKTSENATQKANELQGVEVKVFSRKYCKKQAIRNLFTRQMFCAGRKSGGADSCTYDSGAPLVVNRTLFGVVSWGVGCGRPNSPGYYTNIAVLRQWIDYTVDQLKNRSDPV